VLVHGRTVEKATDAVARLEVTAAVDPGLAPDDAAFNTSHSPSSTGTLIPVGCDLSSLGSVRAFASDIVASYPSLDAVVNNAGVFTSTRQLSADGYELQFAVNHLAGYCLTRLLLPALAASGNGRVVMVSSGSHRGGRIHLRNPGLEGLYLGFSAYAQSKLANILFMRELQRRSEAGRIDAFAFEPGLVNTEMGEKGTGGLVALVWSRRKHHGVTPEEGASTGVLLVTDAGLAGKGGTYWANRALANPSRRATDGQTAVRLWDLSAQMCGLPEELDLGSAQP
jgi:NAD(P)-dependent dehydrogenase (short-subunit alcohol dehydrogenase family)